MTVRVPNEVGQILIETVLSSTLIQYMIDKILSLPEKRFLNVSFCVWNKSFFGQVFSFDVFSFMTDLNS